MTSSVCRRCCVENVPEHGPEDCRTVLKVALDDTRAERDRYQLDFEKELEVIRSLREELERERIPRLLMEERAERERLARVIMQDLHVMTIWKEGRSVRVSDDEFRCFLPGPRSLVEKIERLLEHADKIAALERGKMP